MATPEHRILRRASALLATDIDHTLPEQVAHLLAAHGTHPWAIGRRFGADQAIVVTIAGYLIDVVHIACALAQEPSMHTRLSSANVEAREALRARFDEQLRAAATPTGLPGYVRDEILHAVINEVFAELER